MVQKLFFLPSKIWALISQNIKDFSLLPYLKRALENGNSTSHVVSVKNVSSMLVLYISTAVLSS